MMRKLFALACLCLVACTESAKEPVAVNTGPTATGPAQAAATLVPPPAKTEAVVVDPLKEPGDERSRKAPNVDDGYIMGTVPTKEQVFSWWNRDANEKRNLDKLLEIDELKKIGLVNKEEAYLTAAVFDRGRNGMFSSVLIRPKLREVVELDVIGSEFEILDLDNDGISEIVTRISGSGGGTEIGKKFILHIDKSSVEILHEMNYETNSSLVDDTYKESNISVDWKFSNDNGIPILKETIEKQIGSCNGDKKCKYKRVKELNTYQFIDQQFVNSAPLTPLNN